MQKDIRARTTEWASDLNRFHAAIWAEIGNLTDPRGGYPGLVCLATIGQSGPEQRQLVLRAADKASARLILHTDNKTPKCRELAADPRASVLVWNETAKLQIRATGRIEQLGAYAAQQSWSELPFASRGNYGVEPLPGHTIAQPFDYERSANPNRLGVLYLHIEQIDAVHLGDPQHIRARYAKADGWAGNWLAP